MKLMKVHSRSDVASNCDCTTLIAYTFEGSELSGTAAQLDAASKGQLASLFARGEIPAAVGRSVLLHDVPGMAAKSLLIVGAGSSKTLDEGTASALAELL